MLWSKYWLDSGLVGYLEEEVRVVRGRMGQYEVMDFVLLLTQEGLWFRLGVCVSTIRSWERGRVQPTMTLEQWEELAAAVNVPLNELRMKISRVA